MENKTKNKFFSIISTLLPVVLAFGFFLYTKTITQPIRVVGSSMEPTYHDNQLLLADRQVEKFERFDVVVLKRKGNTIIKRIIGLPGETVEVTKTGIKVNGEYIDDVVNITLDDIGKYNHVVLKNNEYFVLGDNRNNSSDSRVYGPFAQDEVVGKVRT